VCQIQHALGRDGIDPAILERDPNEMVPLEETPAQGQGGGQAEAAKVALKDHPMFAKFFKMLAMRMPKGAAIQAMAKEGLDPAILDRVSACRACGSEEGGMGGGDDGGRAW
jgi:hypothetical protein